MVHDLEIVTVSSGLLLLYNKSPPNLMAQSKHLLSHSYCGSGIQAWRSWEPLSPSEAGNQGVSQDCRHLKALLGNELLLSFFMAGAGLWLTVGRR